MSVFIFSHYPISLFFRYYPEDEGSKLLKHASNKLPFTVLPYALFWHVLDTNHVYG